MGCVAVGLRSEGDPSVCSRFRWVGGAEGTGVAVAGGAEGLAVSVLRSLRR